MSRRIDEQGEYSNTHCKGVALLLLVLFLKDICIIASNNITFSATHAAKSKYGKKALDKG